MIQQSHRKVRTADIRNGGRSPHKHYPLGSDRGLVSPFGRHEDECVYCIRSKRCEMITINIAN